jgi:hypothetical protein
MTTSPEPTSSSPAAAPARERRQRVQAAETGMAVLKGLAHLGGRSSLTALSTHVAESPAKVAGARRAGAGRATPERRSRPCASTTMPKAMRYQANGTKLLVEM